MSQFTINSNRYQSNVLMHSCSSDPGNHFPSQLQLMDAVGEVVSSAGE